MRLWVCTSCARRIPRPNPTRARQWHSAAGSGVTVPDEQLRQPPVVYPANGKIQDDSVLRQLIDAPLKTRSPLRAFLGTRSSANVGLFRNRYLTRPEGFPLFARASIARAQRIVSQVLAASSVAEYRDVVRKLDRLSDVLCRVLDAADFVRVTHPDTRMQDAAAQAWALAYQYMNELNTTPGLCEQLRRAMVLDEVRGSWSEEELIVAQTLLLDFTKSAINHPRETRDAFVGLSQQISELGAAFVDQMAPETPRLSFPATALRGLDPSLASAFTRRGTTAFPTVGPEAAAALRQVHDEDVRKTIYYATRTASSRSVELLERLLTARARLARLSGFESYAHMALRDRMMARTPESVMRFLTALARHNEAEVLQNVADLVAEKRRVVAAPSGADIKLNAWDKDYYMERIRREMMARRSRQEDELSAYFSLGTVVQGLSRVLDNLFGIRLVHRETLPGETWHPDVVRLDFVSDTQGIVAVMYCDLFHRVDKSPNPAHFTIRCSRRIDADEMAEVAADMEGGRLAGFGDDSKYGHDAMSLPEFATPEEAANDGMLTAPDTSSERALFQLPTIALVCDFSPRTSASTTPALLSLDQVETLFHEMGHAAHSVLGRTGMQSVSGTRCATDFAELPSSLLEHLAADPDTLSLVARHHDTGAPLANPELVAAERKRRARRFRGLDTENQIVLAALDQECHSARVLPSSASGSAGFDSTKAFHALQRRFQSASGLGPDPEGTRWHGFFGHLFGYGAAYYSYLFDQVLAERVWRVVLDGGKDGGALKRENGERLRASLLRWGGSRDPWHCLADALGDDALADGGEAAMERVGSWGMREAI